MVQDRLGPGVATRRALCGDMIDAFAVRREVAVFDTLPQDFNRRLRHADGPGRPAELIHGVHQLILF